MMKNYSNDAIKLKMIELSNWQIDAQTTYLVFISALKDMDFWFMLAQKRQIDLTEVQIKRLSWARYYLSKEAECKAFFKMRKSELATEMA